MPNLDSMMVEPSHFSQSFLSNKHGPKVPPLVIKLMPYETVIKKFIPLKVNQFMTQNWLVKVEEARGDIRLQARPKSYARLQAQTSISGLFNALESVNTNL